MPPRRPTEMLESAKVKPFDEQVSAKTSYLPVAEVPGQSSVHIGIMSWICNLLGIGKYREENSGPFEWEKTEKP